jgi:hypothetical protein
MKAEFSCWLKIQNGDFSPTLKTQAERCPGERHLDAFEDKQILPRCVRRWDSK